MSGGVGEGVVAEGHRDAGGRGLDDAHDLAVRFGVRDEHPTLGERGQTGVEHDPCRVVARGRDLEQGTEHRGRVPSPVVLGDMTAQLTVVSSDRLHAASVPGLAVRMPGGCDRRWVARPTHAGIADR